MSYRKIEMFTYQQVIHHIRQGQSDREIAKLKLLGRTKCQTVRAIAQSKGWLNINTPIPEESVLAKAFTSPRRSTQTISSVEPYKGQVLEWGEQRIRATVIYQALVNRFGYQGSYDSVRRFLKKHQKSTTKATTVLHFDPAEAAQVDFGKGPTIKDVETGEEISTWIFVMTLCYSRHAYVEIIPDQSSMTWLGCHRRAFEFFSGVPSKIIIDNAKCAITKASFHDPEVQRAYAECAQGYGFIISPCPPREPQMKGRVESGVKYAKGSFVPLRTFRSIADANAQAKAWILGEAGNRTHGSTHQKPLTMFAELEQHLLIPLPAQPVELATWIKVKVHGDCHVQYMKCRYSVPHQHIRKMLWLRATETTVRVYCDHTLVAQHPRLFKPGKCSTLDQHLPPNAKAYLMRDPAYCRKKAAQIGEDCLVLIELLFADQVLDKLRTAQGIIGLSKKYGKDRLNAACRRAMAFNSLQHRTIKTILEQGVEYEPIPDESSFEMLGQAYTNGRFIRPDNTKAVH